LRSAVEQGDLQMAVSTAHTIKGASGNLGFTDIYEIARGAELRMRGNSLEGVGDAAETIKEKIEVLSRAINRRNRYG
jgi:HPt (histidine-containing phosphotransfer) domain-containing protein